ncbi:MAG TPA: monovalent cation/H(+) antiporter subunit G [Ilumatobacteraceae bacterium]|nr:monovalent cation/H(+) antiporter subunit G [Ilumatobacteraceae bacterium]
MNVVSSVFILLGSLVALLAGVGLLTFKSPYARFHAAGKATPIAFLLVALGAGIELGAQGAAELAIVAAALLLTLPAATHLLFRATHRTTVSDHFRTDELAAAERELAEHTPLSADERSEEPDAGRR